MKTLIILLFAAVSVQAAPLIGSQDLQPSLAVTSTFTVQGNAFSVGGSTLVVSGGKVGIGTASPLQILHVSGNAQVTGQIFTSSGAYTPAYAGWSANPTNACNFIQMGQWVCVQCVNGGPGTSNATTHTVTLPVTSNSGFGQTALLCTAYMTDNGTVITTAPRCDLTSNSKTLTVYKDNTAGSWTASGGSQFSPNVCYLSN